MDQRENKAIMQGRVEVCCASRQRSVWLCVWIHYSCCSFNALK